MNLKPNLRKNEAENIAANLKGRRQWGLTVDNVDVKSETRHGKRYYWVTYTVTIGWLFGSTWQGVVHRRER